MFDGNKRYLLISNYRKEYLCNHYMCKDETFTRCVSISHKLYPKISARSVWRKKSRFFNLSHNVTFWYKITNSMSAFLISASSANR